MFLSRRGPWSLVVSILTVTLLCGAIPTKSSPKKPPKKRTLTHQDSLAWAATRIESLAVTFPSTLTDGLVGSNLRFAVGDTELVFDARDPKEIGVDGFVRGRFLVGTRPDGRDIAVIWMDPIEVLTESDRKVRLILFHEYVHWQQYVHRNEESFDEQQSLERIFHPKDDQLYQPEDAVTLFMLESAAYTSQCELAQEWYASDEIPICEYYEPFYVSEHPEQACVFQLIVMDIVNRQGAAQVYSSEFEKLKEFFNECARPKDLDLDDLYGY